MATLDVDITSLSPSEHQIQLRRAVIASTIGTAIEWYDFFLYSTVTGLVFAKLFFPNSDPWVGTLEAFAIYAVGFVARPIGAAIFGHYGDRIGRKSTLIATLLLMGLATFAVALVPTYESIGIWGAVILTVLRFIQGIGVGGEWGGSVLMSMEWARTNHSRGFIASWPQFGVPCGLFLANLAVLAFSQMSGEQFLAWGWRIPFAAQPRPGRRRALHPARHSGDAGLRQAARRAQGRAHADADGDQAASRRRSCSPPSRAWPSRRRSTSSPPSSSPTASARCTSRATSCSRRCSRPRCCRSSRFRSSAICPTASAARTCT